MYEETLNFQDQDTHWILHNQEAMQCVLKVTDSDSESIQVRIYYIPIYTIFWLLTHVG